MYFISVCKDHTDCVLVLGKDINDEKSLIVYVLFTSRLQLAFRSRHISGKHFCCSGVSIPIRRLAFQMRFYALYLYICHVIDSMTLYSPLLFSYSFFMFRLFFLLLALLDLILSAFLLRFFGNIVGETSLGDNVASIGNDGTHG